MICRSSILIVGTVTLVVGIVLWLLLPPTVPDPVYQGHPVSYWLERSTVILNTDLHGPELHGSDVVIGTMGSWPASNTTALWHNMDSNAVPFLVHALKLRDTLLHRLIFLLYQKSPNWLSSRLRPPANPPFEKSSAANALGELGPQASAAIPALIRTLEAKDATLAPACSAWALGEIGQPTPEVLRALQSASTVISNQVLATISSNALQKLTNHPAQ